MGPGYYGYYHGYSPYFDGYQSHNLTTSSRVNLALEDVNRIEQSINMRSGYPYPPGNPNAPMMNYLRGIESGLGIPQGPMSPGMQQGGGAYGMPQADQSSHMGRDIAGGAVAGAVIGTLIAPGPGTAIGAVVGGALGLAKNLLGF